MKENLVISLYEVIGNSLCVASSDGQKAYERVAAALKEDRNITLSFRNITLLTSAFLNSAIGQLYGTFSEEKIRSLLEIRDIQPDDLALLKRVVETAKQYFKDPKKFNQAIKEALENESDET